MHSTQYKLLVQPTVCFRLPLLAKGAQLNSMDLTDSQWLLKMRFTQRKKRPLSLFFLRWALVGGFLYS